MRKRWKILISVFSVWVIISAFFFYNHLITVKRMNISGWAVGDSEAGIQVKQIRLVNKKHAESGWGLVKTPLMQLVNYLPTENLKFTAFL
ncbi:MAG: hypothetical protein ACYC4E_02720 [Carboxydocellales bacterium]